MTTDKTQVAAFYDAFVPQQKRAAFNERHQFLFQLMLDCALDSRSHVLELGCGIGVMTSLVAKVNRQGRVVAVDISSASISEAKRCLPDAPHVELVVGDVVDVAVSGGPFNLVTLFDVMEHVPVERHTALFRNVAHFMSPDSLLLVNIPNPAYLDYLRQNEPETLQVVDQSLPGDQITACAYSSGLRLRFFFTYSLWREDDYQIIAFEKDAPFEDRDIPSPAVWSRWLRRFRRLLSPRRPGQWVLPAYARQSLARRAARAARACVAPRRSPSPRQDPPS